MVMFTTVLTAEQFKAALERHLEVNNLTMAALARQLGKGESTIKDWRRTGIKRDDARQKIIDAYPGVFALEASVPTPARTNKTGPHADLLVLIKTEQARHDLLALRSVLVWFLFDASAEERNQFRDMLGDEWKNFLELTRAMTNETAFEVTKNEGRLEWCRP